MRNSRSILKSLNDDIYQRIINSAREDFEVIEKFARLIELTSFEKGLILQ